MCHSRGSGRTSYGDCQSLPVAMNTSMSSLIMQEHCKWFGAPLQPGAHPWGHFNQPRHSLFFPAHAGSVAGVASMVPLHICLSSADKWLGGANQTLKRMLHNVNLEGCNWDLLLPYVLFTVHERPQALMCLLCSSCCLGNDHGACWMSPKRHGRHSCPLIALWSNMFG